MGLALEEPALATGCVAFACDIVNIDTKDIFNGLFDLWKSALITKVPLIAQKEDCGREL